MSPEREARLEVIALAGMPEDRLPADERLRVRDAMDSGHPFELGFALRG